MTTFEEQGFLSTQVSQIVANIHSKYQGWFQVIQAINTFAQDIQFKIEIHLHDMREIVTASLFSRTLSNFQAGVLLCERGMDIQARILFRAAMESMFTLIAASKDKDVVDCYIKADELNRLEMYKKIRDWSPELSKSVDKVKLEKTRQEIEKSIKKLKAKKITVREMAVKAEMEQWYLAVYPTLSASTHTSVRDLEKHLVLRNKEEIVGLKNEPVLDELDHILLMSSEIMLSTLGALERVFNIQVEHFITDQNYKLSQLAQHIPGTKADQNEYGS